MRSRNDSSSRVSTPSNAFSPDFLEALQAGEEPLTASEADLAGPWKREAVPGQPGAVAVLRDWENQDEGDVPEVVFRHEERAALCTMILPLIEREPLVHLGEEPAADGPLPGGYPVTAIYGEQGPQVVGWSRRYQPQVFFALHLIEGVVRSPQILAEINRAAGGGALAQVGRYLAARQED